MDAPIEYILPLINIFSQFLASRKKERENYLKVKLVIERKRYENRLLLAKLLEKHRKRQVTRSCWVRPELLLNDFGKFWENVVPLYSDKRFFEKFRMSRNCFNELCHSLKPYIAKKNTNYRNAIPVGKRIAITILKGCIDFWTVADLFGIGQSTVGYLLKEFCAAVILHYSYLIKFPRTEEERSVIANGFWNKFQFYNCFGAMDGTHIPILPPSNEAVDYYNYKGFYSINVLAVADHKYRFTYILSGAPGRCNDASIFRRSKLFEKFENDDNSQTRYHLIADAAFPLLSWVMKPFPETLDIPLMNRNFNYRLSSARMVIENAFGRLKARWRILSRRPDLHLDNMRHLIKACLILNNFCENCGEEVPDEWVERAAEEERLFIQNILVPSINVAIDNSEEINNEAEVDELYVEDYNAKLKRIKLADQLFKDGLSICRNQTL